MKRRNPGDGSSLDHLGQPAMKPRLESAAWTYEDQHIWYLVGMKNPGGMNLRALWDCWTQSDRRDADLMLDLVVAYGDIMHRGYPQWRVWHAAFAFYGIPIPADYCVYD